MKYSPDRQTVGQILSLTNPPVVVPDWQRNYSWTTAEIETFWQDLVRFNEQYPDQNIEGEEYFLGAIVIVDMNNAHLLLDGQQRVASAAILISVIRDFLARYKADAATRVSTRYLTDFDDALEDYTYKITLNRYDRDYFKRMILENHDAGWAEPEVQYESHEYIKRAQAFFTKKFEEKYAEINNPPLAHQWALRILKVLTSHVSVVAVISKDEDNASSVFETLNDRGIGLSTTDLLRNLILRRANEAHLNEILDLWGEILEIEGDVKLQDFFRHFWISREGDIKARSLYREVKLSILEKDINSLAFSRELSDSAQVYQDILSAKFDGSDVISGLLADINELGAKVLFPPVLSLLETKTEFALIEKFIKYFIIAYVRHSLVGKRENSLFENLMFSIAKDIRNADSDDDQILSRITDFCPDDEAFKQAFSNFSIGRIASARYLLRNLERHKRETEELDVAAPARVHVEHIYPQTPPPERRLQQHASVINRVGNLTLLSARLNMAIKNGEYAQKRDAYVQSELRITNEIAENFEDWNEESINSRQADLSEQAIMIWRFD